MGEKVAILRNKYLPQLVSLAVALMLWMYVQNSEQIEIFRRIPVHILLPDDVGMVTRPPQEITVRMRGARSSLRNIRNETEHFINLKGMGIRGRKSLMIPIKNEELPVHHFGIKIVDYSPKEITIDLDVMVVRQIPIKATVIGEMNGGGALVSQLVTPSSVSVKGAKDYLKSISHISTKPLDLATINGPGEWKVPLEIDDQRMILLDAAPREVNVKLDIKAARFDRRSVDVPVRFISQGQLFHAQEQTVNVSFFYPNTLSIEELEKGIKIDLEIPDKSGQHNLKVDVVLPEGLRLHKISPNYIPVKVDKRSNRK